MWPIDSVIATSHVYVSFKRNVNGIIFIREQQCLLTPTDSYSLVSMLAWSEVYWGDRWCGLKIKMLRVNLKCFYVEKSTRDNSLKKKSNLLYWNCINKHRLKNIIVLHTFSFSLHSSVFKWLGPCFCNNAFKMIMTGSTHEYSRGSSSKVKYTVHSIRSAAATGAFRQEKGGKMMTGQVGNNRKEHWTRQLGIQNHNRLRKGHLVLYKTPKDTLYQFWIECSSFSNPLMF